MVAVADIIAEVRKEEKDVDEVVFSDYDMVNAINKTLRMLSNQLTMMNTEFLERSVDIAADDAAVGEDLPSDYVMVRKVVSTHGNMRPTNGKLHYGEYYISNGKIYAKEDITLLYKGCIPAIALGGNIEAPPFLFDLIAAITRMVLTNTEKDVMIQYITNASKMIVPQRKYGNAKLGMQFRV